MAQQVGKIETRCAVCGTDKQNTSDVFGNSNELDAPYDRVCADCAREHDIKAGQTVADFRSAVVNARRS